MINNVFGEILCQQRLRKGISQEALAHEAGIHRTYVSQLERGLKSPTLDVIFRLSKALDIKAEKIVGLVERRSGKTEVRK